jgi:predicted transcriptional regulator
LGADDAAADGRETALDHVTLLTKRYGVLAQLDRQPREKRALVENLDVSRSTVDRALRSLSAAGLLRRSGETFEQTLSGRQLSNEFEGLLTVVEGVQAAQPLLSHLPTSAPLPPHVVRTADVIRGEEADQVRPNDYVTDLLRTADRIRGFVRAHSDTARDATIRGPTASGMRADLVFQQGVFDLVADRFPKRFADLVASDNFDARRIDAVPFGMFLTERPEGAEVAVLVYDAHTLCGVLASTHSASLEWAHELFAAARDDATPVAPIDSVTDIDSEA